jgi:hypothetical protein
LSGYGVRLSQELNQEIALQPRRVRDEFWKAHDQLARFGLSGPAPDGQLELPLPVDPAGAPRTRPFGLDGWIVHRTGEGEVEILQVHWPSSPDCD